jgi:hypothetical protein
LNFLSFAWFWHFDIQEEEKAIKLEMENFISPSHTTAYAHQLILGDFMGTQVCM